MASEAWHARSAENVARILGTDLARGLSAEAARVRAHGVERVPSPRKRTLAGHVARQFWNPIALLLLIAAPVSAAVGTTADALVILAALLINVALGAYQEARTDRTFELLRRREAARAVVIRDGKRREVSALEVVPGDIVELAPGTAVPADLRLVETHNLSLNESALSGEWLPAEKGVEATAVEAPLAERRGMAYAGSFVAAGAGRGVAVAVGRATEFGAIAASLGELRRPVTPLARDLARAARYLALFVALLETAVLALSFFAGMSLAEALRLAVAVTVASIPEGLPVAVAVVLSLGMARILAAGGLVKSLLAAETLGATSVILTDKTGTLTAGRMRVAGVITPACTTEPLTSPAAAAVIRGAILATNGFIETRVASAPADETVVAHGSPMEQAVVLAALEAGVSIEGLREEHPRLDALPFDSARRVGGVLVAEGRAGAAYLTAAPEFFDDGAADERLAEARELAAREGTRVVAVARVPWQARVLPDEASLPAFLAKAELLGYLLLADPVRRAAARAVAEMRAAGARVVMVTGDDRETALAVARAVGIAGERATGYLGGRIEGLSDEELLRAVMTHAVFARVSPTEKLRIARVLSGAGEVVAMTGDGVNDAPALRAAAIGVALGSGTEVAKEAADLVLLDDSFATVTAAIREGRRMRSNIKKIFAYLVATNFGEVTLVLAALAAGLPLPLAPTQILWSNLVGGGLMNIAYAFEPLSRSAMARSPKDEENAAILSRGTLKLIALMGLATGALLAATYAYLVESGAPLAELRTVMFTAVALDSFSIAFSLKSFGTPVWRIPLAGNRFLFVAMAASLAVLAAALFLPPVSAIVGTAPLAPRDFAIPVALAIAELIAIELIKYAVFIRPAALKRAEVH